MPCYSRRVRAGPHQFVSSGEIRPTHVYSLADPEPLTAEVEPPNNDVAWIKEGAFFPNHPIIREALNLEGKATRDQMDDCGMTI